MLARQLRANMVVLVGDDEKWKLVTQDNLFVPGSSPPIPVENRRRNKWLARRVSDGKEHLLCFDVNAEVCGVVPNA